MDDLEAIAKLEYVKASGQMLHEMQEKMQHALAGKPLGGVMEQAKLQVQLDYAERLCKELGRIWENLLEARSGGQLTRENANFIIQKVMDEAAARKSNLGAAFPDHTSGVNSEVGRRMDSIVASIRRDLEIRIRKQEAFPPKADVSRPIISERLQLRAGLSPSDKLAIALACLAGIMAIILFLLAKTPTTVVLSLVAMVGLGIYPILHFFRTAGFRLIAILALLGSTVLIGRYTWPGKNSGDRAEVPATFTAPSVTQSPSVPANPSQIPTAKAQPSPRKNHKAAGPVPPQPSMSQECAPGASCAQSQGQQGGITAGVYNGPPPLELKPSLSIIPSNTGKFQFPVEECPVKTQITVVPNQAVPPPIEIALDFDNPVSQISASVEGANAIMLGGPFRLGIHALTTVVSPGFSATHPLIVEVCSSERLKLVAAPHLE
jgi:hypothetical protein